MIHIELVSSWRRQDIVEVYFSSRRELTRRNFSRRFSTEAAWKVKMLWRQTSPVTPCFGLDSTKTWCRNPTKPAGLIRITIRITIWIMIVQNSWIFSICEILLRIWDCRPFSVLKTLTGSRAEKCHKTWFSVHQTLDLRAVKHFRIAWLF